MIFVSEGIAAIPDASRLRAALIRSAQIVFCQRHPISRPHGQDGLIEIIFGVVHHLARAASQETIGALLLLQHEGKIFRRKEGGAGIDHLILAKGSLCNPGGLFGFARIVDQYSTGHAFADCRGASEGLRLMGDDALSGVPRTISMPINDTTAPMMNIQRQPTFWAISPPNSAAKPEPPHEPIDHSEIAR